MADDEFFRFSSEDMELGLDPCYGMWTTKEGKQIPIRDMKYSHIQNCIALLKKHEPQNFESWVDRFEIELRLQKLEGIKLDWED